MKPTIPPGARSFLVGLTVLLGVGDVRAQDKDALGDPLPAGAVARIGTTRYRLTDSTRPESVTLSPDGKHVALLKTDGSIEVRALPAWSVARVITPSSIDPDEPPRFLDLAFTADGKRLVSGDGTTREVHLIDAATGKSVKKIKMPPKKSANDPFFLLSADQKTLVHTYRNSSDEKQPTEMVIWDVAKDQQLHFLSAPRNENRGFRDRETRAVSADGARWAQYYPASDRAGQPNDFIAVWDLKAGKMLHKIAAVFAPQLLAFSPDGKQLAAAAESLLRLYDADTGKERQNIRMRAASIVHLQFSPKADVVYLADLDGKIHGWNTATGERIATHTPPTSCVVRDLVFRPDGAMIALGHFAAALHIWEFGGKRFSPVGLPESDICDVLFSPRGELFVSCDQGATAWWNPRTGARLRDLFLEGIDSSDTFLRNEALSSQSRWHRRGEGARSILSPDGEFVRSSYAYGLGYFDAKTGKLLYHDTRSRERHVAFVDGGSKSAAVEGKKLRVWQTRTGRDLATFDLLLHDKETPIRLVAAPGGTQFAVATVNAVDQTRIFLFDTDLKKVVRDWRGNSNQDRMLFSPDGIWLVRAGQDNHLHVTHVATSKADHHIEMAASAEEFTRLAFSPDGRQLACAVINSAAGRGRSSIFVVEMASKKVRLEWAAHPDALIECLAYSPDSGLLASGATDTTVLVWRAGLREYASRPRNDATEEEVAGWFKQMGGADAKAAYQHMIKLVQTPKQAVKLFAARIAPATQPDLGGKTIGQWVADLGSGQFAVRTKATAMLQKLGLSAAPALRAALSTARDVEMKRRIEEMLDRVAAPEWSAEDVLHARAVEVLEALADAESRALLTRWSAGHGPAVLTSEARKALANLDRNAKKSG